MPVPRTSAAFGEQFFWSQHHDVVLGYVGHAERFDPPEITVE